MKVNRFINNPGKPFHTSGFAKAANGNGIGAASPETFERRKQVDRNRQAVRKYGESHMGRAVQADRVRIQTARRIETPAVPDSRQRYNAGAAPEPRTDTAMPVRPSFTEPTPRRFDPFE